MLRKDDCILFSGGAPGAEAAFGEEAEKHGVEEVNFTFEGHTEARQRGRRVLNHEELLAGDVSLAYVSKLMNRRYTEGPQLRKVLQSIWYQVNHGQEIYVIGYIRLSRRGYKISFLKVYLLASTGLCSIYTWGFNPWGQAFFIMNVFHAVQYLGLVWHTERKLLLKNLRLDKARAGGIIAAVLFLSAVLGYGVVAHVVATEDLVWLWCITQVVALMHFWYDGFIWSVKKSQV